MDDADFDPYWPDIDERGGYSGPLRSTPMPIIPDDEDFDPEEDEDDERAEEEATCPFCAGKGWTPNYIGVAVKCRDCDGKGTY